MIYFHYELGHRWNYISARGVT